MADNVRIVDHTSEVERALNNAFSRALEAVGLHLEGESKDELENAPRRIDTGNLRNSITHIVNDEEKAVYVGTNVEYGIYVHEGTVKMEPNRFLKNALEKNKNQIRTYFESQLKS